MLLLLYYNTVTLNRLVEVAFEVTTGIMVWYSPYGMVVPVRGSLLVPVVMMVCMIDLPSSDAAVVVVVVDTT